MEGETNQQQPTPCRTGCGFYGNQASDGLCSKCYKDTIKRNQDASQAAAMGPTASATPSTTTSTTQTPDLKDLSSPERPSTSATQPTPETETQKEVDTATSPIAEASEPDATSTLDTSMSPDKGKKKNRCNVCRKKVGLTGFVCRCSGLFCGLHRYSDKHDCSYDYKADAREQIAKQNPVIVGEKVKKI